ncbi:hypothetical protein [uncultured Cyclobacterium sp.]|uniref:hypothetical protein n=1 Tax=uncultured Cyclobacterium sp. TaxID=453820 RepID=UPI0030EEF2EC|tara:strand:- start:120802 stop:122100 length:1299 start_codon:yes stop_codon:yes gene_type:complete
MLNNSVKFLDLIFNHKINKTLDLFWLGVVIYFAGFTLSTTTTVSYIICQLSQLLGILLFLPTAINLIHWKFDNKYLKIVFIIYCSWQLSVISRGFSFEYEDLKSYLFDVDGGVFRYFVPLILLFPKNIFIYKKIYNVIFILGILFIIYTVLFFNNLMNLNYINNDTKFTFEHFTKILSVPIGFIFLTFLYHSNRKKIFAALIITLSVVFAIIRARRTLLFMNITPLLFTFMFYLSIGKRKFLILIFSLILGSSIFLYGIKIYNENKNGVFSLLTERVYEDTRTNVEDCLYEDMNNIDWIIGKGINGKYYCSGIDLNDNSGYRKMIETEYLNIILKGGVISLGLLLLILIPAIVKGVFYSNNLLSKAAAIWILIWVLELYPANVYSFCLNHILVWISVGICYSKSIRKIPESVLLRILSNDSLIRKRKVIFSI